jgi:hypothetical protein
MAGLAVRRRMVTGNARRRDKSMATLRFAVVSAVSVLRRQSD